MAYYSYLWKIDEVERTKYLAGLNNSSVVQAPIDSLDSTNVGAATQVATNTKKTDYFAHAGQYIVPPREVKKTKYGIVKYEPYWLKTYRMKTAPMENVLTPEKPQPLIQQEDTIVVDVGEIYRSDFSDSLSLDSTVIASTAKDTLEEAFVLPTLARAKAVKKKAETKYLYGYDPKDRALNVEQDYYNKHFGEYLVSKPPRPRPVVEEPATSDSTNIEDGQFNQLAPAENDTTGGVILEVPRKQKKKRTKRNRKQDTSENPDQEATEPDDQPAEEPKQQEPKEEEAEDDGF